MSFRTWEVRYHAGSGFRYGDDGIPRQRSHEKRTAVEGRASPIINVSLEKKLDTDGIDIGRKVRVGRGCHELSECVFSDPGGEHPAKGFARSRESRSSFKRLLAFPGAVETPDARAVPISGS